MAASHADSIDLAHSDGFRLGRLEVRPGVRQLVRDDGAGEVLEPRVMQVLVALARADGGILSRDDLTRLCWENRVVGEDAINRVISRLRRAAEGIGAGSFRIETITKVGYRLLRAADGPAVDGGERVPPARPVARRALLLGGAGLAATALVATGVALLGREAQGPPPEIAPIVTQGLIALRQSTAEGTVQATGLFRRAVALRPDYADGWALLALCYAYAAHSRAARYEEAMRARARAAADRARALDPDNAYASVALATLLPRIGHWTAYERALRDASARHPDDDILPVMLAAMLWGVGRAREGARLMDRAVALTPTPTPAVLYQHVQMLWAAGRLEDADAAMARAFDLFPTHFALWFTRFYLLLYTGRPEEAAGMALNVGGRPAGIPAAEFMLILTVARAMESGRPQDIDRAMAENLAAAHRGAGFAENTIQFASALGRLDAAFEVAEGYFFGRGFAVDDVRFTPEQGGYTRLGSRRTWPIFMPSTAAMRRDPRFERLVEELGLTRYWREAGVVPDYRRG